MKKELSTASAVLTGAVAVGVCSAAPEFIWQGLRVVGVHISTATVVSAILAAIIIVFFVEPILSHVRVWLGDGPPIAHRSPRHLAVSAAVGTFVALMSVGLHDAMSAFATADDPTGHAGIQRAIVVTIAWGAVPFAIMLAWQAAQHRYLAIPLGVIAAASSFIAGWYFNWGVTTTVTTAIPCLSIQSLGYRRALEPRDEIGFAHYAPTVAVAGIAWLIGAQLYDFAARHISPGLPLLYDKADFAVDVRFYIGWFLGLVLTRPTIKPGHSTPKTAAP